MTFSSQLSNCYCSSPTGDRVERAQRKSNDTNAFNAHTCTETSRASRSHPFPPFCIPLLASRPPRRRHPNLQAHSSCCACSFRPVVGTFLPPENLRGLACRDAQMHRCTDASPYRANLRNLHHNSLLLINVPVLAIHPTIKKKTSFIPLPHLLLSFSSASLLRYF